MKVLLINPPRENELVGNNPPLIDEERGYNPPLGLLYLGAYLKRYSRHEVEVIDAQVEELSYSHLKHRISDARPDVVGITAMTFTLLDVIKTARLVKEVASDLPVVIGGPHAYIFPTETAGLQGVDFVLTGEGEKNFFLLLEHLYSDRNFDSVPGLVYNQKGNLFQNPPARLIEDLDEVPFPDRTLSPYNKYTSVVARRKPITTMITSRGCPYRCSFCARPHLGKRFRMRSAQNVVNEMEECIKLGIREFLIYDDTFTVNRKRVMDVCDEIVRRKLDIGWDIRARVDSVDEEMLEKLNEANCERIHYGVESGTEKILNVLSKGISTDQARKAIKETKKAGIQTLAYFMIGSPTETREDILKTMDFALELAPDFVHITITTPFPATEIYERGLKQGVFKNDYWREFASAPRPGFRPPYWNEHLCDEELQDLLKSFYKKFYARPKYIFRELKQVKSFREFKTKVKAGLKIFHMKTKRDVES